MVCQIGVRIRSEWTLRRNLQTLICDFSLFQVRRAMTQSREALAMMDGTTVTFSKRQGYVLSRWGIALIAALFLTTIVATGLLVYKFASCTQNEHGGACAKDGVQNGRASVPVLPTEPGVAPPAAPSDAPKLDVRLPRAVKPDSYKIEIIPFIHEGNFTFSGKVSVVVNATEPTSNITLHFNDIKIYEDSVTVEEHESVADGSHRPAGKLKGVRCPTSWFQCWFFG